MPHSLTAIECTGISLERLRRGGDETAVHSMFANGLNLDLGGRLLHIGDIRNGLSPFGISLSPSDICLLLGNIRVGERVRWLAGSEELLFPESLFRISLRNVLPQCSRVHHYPVTPAGVVRRNSERLARLVARCDTANGLGVSNSEAADVLRGFAEPASDDARMLRRLQVAIVTFDGPAVEGMMRRFVGRGQGLTPSGDDLLVGCLSVAVPGTRPGVLLSDCLRRIAHIDGPGLTTRVGWEYLWHAAEGHFSSLIRKVVHSLMQGDGADVDNALGGLFEVGHSSGIDTAIGMMLYLSIEKETIAES